jgi:hypothetical protein
MAEGYFKFPRSILSDPRYKGARLKYKHVLHIILENALFRKTTHSIGVEIVSVDIGQFCVSERQLVDLCNEGVRYKEDLVDKNIVHRAVHFWRTCGFVNQQVIHEKNLLTVTVPEFYTKEKTTSEPQSESRPNHNRTTKEEQEEQEEQEYTVSDSVCDKQIQTPRTARKSSQPRIHEKSSISFSFSERRFEGIPDADLQLWKEAYPSVKVEQEIKSMADWCLGNPEKSQKRRNWRKFISSWLKSSNDKADAKEGYQNAKLGQSKTYRPGYSDPNAGKYRSVSIRDFDVEDGFSGVIQ